MDKKLNLIELLDWVDPSYLEYQEWVNVGMALKHEGYTAADWEAWSARDTGRYRPGECFKKWDGFSGFSGSLVTGATITKLAKDHGWKPTGSAKEDHELEWDSVIGSKDYVLIEQEWIEGREVEEPDQWSPVKDLVTYLETLFEAGDNVGYVTESWEKDGRFLPKKGVWDRTAGQLIQELSTCGGDIANVVGDVNKGAGAWIRFNPMDGQGCKNENVAEFRYALVESDTMDIDKQNAIIRELELPVACLVHSGGKSIHAIVRVDAPNYDEYRKRVDYLYNVCQKNGLKIDTQNKNPSRLSRMPGVLRNGNKQFLVGTNIGKETWAEWYEWIEGVNDDLPEPESLEEFFNKLPPLSPPLIHGVLRQGHKMLLAGPSKAGKSYALIELCIAVAEGYQWLGWDCTKGRILYVNLELDRASCLHRFRDVYDALGMPPSNIGNIDIWNLRGKSVPMDKLAPKLIRRAHKKNYIAVVIDPIYKVITGDENSADQMAHFANQFDKICTELGTAVIYCHHHSKGAQGGKKAMDRASGSGVFARDPDALLDLSELEITDAVLKQEENRMTCGIIADAIRTTNPYYHEVDVSQDDLQSAVKMKHHASLALNKAQENALHQDIEKGVAALKMQTAWRIDGTLREFPKFKPINLWFRYPVHALDDTGMLGDLETEGEKPPWQKAIDKRKSPEKKKENRTGALDIAYASLEMDGTGEDITVTLLADEMEVSKKTVWNRIKEHGGFLIEKQEGKDSRVLRKE